MVPRLMTQTTDALTAYATALRKELKRLKDADTERQQKAVHRIRVATRRLEVLLGMLEKPRRKGARRLRRELKNLRRLLGKVREGDVHRLLWKDIGRGLVCFRAIEREIERRRAKAFDRFQRKWKGKRFNGAFKRVDKVWKAEKNGKRTSASQSEIAATISKWTAKILQAPKSSDALESIHAIRLQVKKLRYLLENFEAAAHFKTVNAGSLLKDMQKELGHIHDLETFVEFLKKTGQRDEDLWDPRTRSAVEKASEELKQGLHASVTSWHRNWPERRKALAAIRPRPQKVRKVKK